MRLRLAAALIAAQSLCATLLSGADITSGNLQIQGLTLEIETQAVTTGVSIPTTIQTRFNGKTDAAAAVVEGLSVLGELTGPGIDTPIQLTTAPGFRFQIPGLPEGVYYLQNVRLMKGSDFIAPAIPSVAAITVANILQTSVTVRQLTPEEIRARGIVVDGQNYNVYGRIGGLQIAGFIASRGEIHGSLLYLVGIASSEMVVVSLADPAQPVIAGRLTLPAGAGGIRVLDDTTLIATTSAGAVATTVDPAHLRLTGSATTGGNASDIAVTGGFAYVAMDAGIAIVPVNIAPIIDVSRISLSMSGSVLTVTGAARSIASSLPTSVIVKNATSGATVSIAVEAGGSFVTTIAASAGDAITITATDSQNRASGPINIGTAPSGAVP